MWLINYLRAGQVNKFDLVVFMVAALAVMFAGVEIGLAISIGLSIALALWKSAFPHTAVLGKLPDTTVYRCVPYPARNSAQPQPHPSLSCAAAADDLCLNLLACNQGRVIKLTPASCSGA